MHFPQTPIAQAEARLIANTDNQYLVPTSGDPLRGLIQDHVVAGVWMTNKETFFTRAEYCQLLYGALRPEDNYSGGGTVQTVPPAILRPKPLWTGKQIVSCLHPFTDHALTLNRSRPSSSILRLLNLVGSTFAANPKCQRSDGDLKMKRKAKSTSWMASS